MIFVLGIIIGFGIFKLFSGKREGNKIKRSFRFLVNGYYIHIHHWIWCTILLILLLIINFQNQFIYGFLLGSIIQGLLYKDRFVVIYKKGDLNKIYSKFI